MILIITSKRDGHIGHVTQHIDALKHPWVRINTEDLPKNIGLSVDPASGKGFLSVRDSKRSFRLSDVTAVWFRKPDPLDLSHFALDKASLDYVEAEFNEVVQGLYALLKDVLWINNPLTTRLTHRKMLQLRVAREVGFATPQSLITNDSKEALGFCERIGWNVAIKSLGAISVTSHQGETQMQYGIFTRKVGEEELLTLQDKIEHMPTLFQEYIHKSYELRVTCVGDKVFSCRIDSQSSDLAREDFRFDSRNLKHEALDCHEIHDKLLGYMRAFGINFGCFDIAVTKSGEHIFFECNPNGQWLWIEELTGMPIGKAIAELLVTGNGIDRSRLN